MEYTITPISYQFYKIKRKNKEEVKEENKDE